MSEKKALLLENVDRGTIQTVLQTNGYYRQTKLLNSSEKNWKSICEIIEYENKTKSDFLIIGKLTEHTLFRMCLPEYEETIEKFIELLKLNKHLLFIYKDNLFGNFSHFVNINNDIDLDKISPSILKNSNQAFYINYISRWINQNNLNYSEEEYLEKVNNLITRLNNEVKILPYEKLIDIEIAGQMFIENITEGLLFRVYIPNERIWSNEFNKFISLFRDFSSMISNESITISQNKTDLGIVCSLYSSSQLNPNKIKDLYKEFTYFMEICAKSPEQAEEIINKLDINEGKKKSIFLKYTKETQRLILDLQQEREIKILNIKHRLQNEISEIEIDNKIINYIDNSVPKTSIHSLESPIQIIQNQNIYNNSQVFEKINGIVGKEINGNINFSAEESELEKTIEKLSTDMSEKIELLNSLYELKDSNSSQELKRSSRQKLYGFIGKAADKIGQVGVSLLTKYLENQII